MRHYVFPSLLYMVTHEVVRPALLPFQVFWIEGLFAVATVLSMFESDQNDLDRLQDDAEVRLVTLQHEVIPVTLQHEQYYQYSMQSCTTTVCPPFMTTHESAMPALPIFQIHWD